MTLRNKLALVIALFAPGLLYAQSPTVKVAPWNNHKAALTLAFDDALPVHLDVAVPELTKRHLRGSFFLTVDQVSRMADWKAAQQAGNELGNHSVSHELPEGLTKDGAGIQVFQAKWFLENNFNTPMLDYAYPFGIYNDDLRKNVEVSSFIARTVVGDNYFIDASGPTDWFAVPAHEAGLMCDEDDKKTCDQSVIQGWVDTVIEKKAWTTILMHGIGTPETGYNPIPVPLFNGLLDYAAGKQPGLWVAPFVEVGAYLRASKTFEEAKETRQGGVFTFKWTPVDNFPEGVKLKLTVSEPYLWTVTQSGDVVAPDKTGVYTIDFDAGELTVTDVREAQ